MQETFQPESAPSPAPAGREPFITAYGDNPLVVLTEAFTAAGVCCARVVRPRGIRLSGTGRSWPDAHWDLFNRLVSEFMTLDRLREGLDPVRLALLTELDHLRADGTLDLVASIARRGMPGATSGPAGPA